MCTKYQITWRRHQKCRQAPKTEKRKPKRTLLSNERKQTRRYHLTILTMNINSCNTKQLLSDTKKKTRERTHFRKWHRSKQIEHWIESKQTKPTWNKHSSNFLIQLLVFISHRLHIFSIIVSIQTLHFCPLSASTVSRFACPFAHMSRKQKREYCKKIDIDRKWRRKIRRKMGFRFWVNIQMVTGRLAMHSIHSTFAFDIRNRWTTWLVFFASRWTTIALLVKFWFPSTLSSLWKTIRFISCRSCAKNSIYKISNTFSLFVSPFRLSAFDVCDVFFDRNEQWPKRMAQPIDFQAAWAYADFRWVSNGVSHSK